MPEKNKIYHSRIFDILADSGGEIGLSEFVRAALYRPSLGYYAKAQTTRIGGEGADFYTAESMKENVFGALMESAAQSILMQSRGAAEAAKAAETVEIGSEGGRTMIAGARAVGIGEDIAISPGSLAVSNELLDAQPFDRFEFSEGAWRKTFLKIRRVQSGARRGCAVKKILRPAAPEERGILEKYFGRCQTAGFCIDFSFDALELFKKIVAQNRGGLSIFSDYFRTAGELASFPGGTARTYKSHACGSDIFEDAGSRDITYSPCSDVFLDAALECGAARAECMGQEEFFMRYAQGEIRRIVEIPDPLDRRKRELCQLLNPGMMGRVFRVLAIY